ncbi:MAG: ribbon-helix-helix domain-containing protein [Euryarchaeota archaeon]|nr:ribbon-helix-helix domain-containing protein [Euryarchaeota archaeon]MBU4220623.1 ribbon-helix-helix domain-containing protein [Euryarchaeota archaeon]MBU4339300.1 ribbon-helix-helix domain-containing protein [Euryarchaeota archaeon]MBU4453655.1 ribbon-helix-helix domain-containing protein [Euryarchaeota archaeon]
MSEMLTFREDDETIKKIDELARQKMRSRSEIVRLAVRDYVNRKLELIEIQKLAAKRYTEGKLSLDELVDILGFNEAKKVAHYKDLAESSFAQGMS